MKPMHNSVYYNFLRRQIPVLIGLSLVPGLAYVFLGLYHGIYKPALIWYSLNIFFSLWAFRVYRKFQIESMSALQIKKWYREMSFLYYGFFGIWLLVFILYVRESSVNLHYIAIYTEIGASVVAATMLLADKKLFLPVLTGLMVPLAIFFLFIGELYSYILSFFSLTLLGVLIYSSFSGSALFQRVIEQASHDMLTGLFNRQYFSEFFQRALNSMREKNYFSYLLLMDLDHFKTINDTLGHDMGDRLLKSVAKRILNAIPEGDIAARLGGDEFLVTGSEFSDLDECRNAALALADKITAVLKESYVIEDHHLFLSVSIGISLVQPSHKQSHDILKEADIAMYEVKAGGRDGAYLFDEEMLARTERYLSIEMKMYRAIKNNEIRLLYQPQFDREKKIIGVEVLARWEDEHWGEISPSEFIPIAEQTGLIIEMGQNILEQAFVNLKAWHDAGIFIEKYSINVSKRQILTMNFFENVMKLMKQHLGPELIPGVRFEITESVVMDDMGKVLEIMHKFRQEGITFSMDDFGTGYSALAYLKNLPIEEIKIDRQFIRDLLNNYIDREMLMTIIAMASVFKLSTVAEGVENEEQFKFLCDINCKEFQGYYFSRPLSDEEFRAKYFSMAWDKKSVS